jgi:DNA-3-methyladenine glycosylase I
MAKATPPPLSVPLGTCPWPQGDALMMDYHDHEWGVPCRDDRLLFEHIVLDAFQAGLSWRTILYKRENFRAALAGFDPVLLAQFGERDVERLMQDVGIVRNRQKIEATIRNAQLYLEMQRDEGSLHGWLWAHVDGVPVVNRWTDRAQIPAKTALSDTISKALMKRGFKFVGSTIVYAWLQACGVVNDHLVSCPRYGACGELP